MTHGLECEHIQITRVVLQDILAFPLNYETNGYPKLLEFEHQQDSMHQSLLKAQ